MKNNKYNCLDSNNFESIVKNFNCLFDSSNYEIASSVVPIDINDLSDEEKKKAKIIIVGSITPWNGNGWFYTAPRTKMYKVLDQVIPNANFDYLKSNGKINELKEALKKEGIYFIDVFKKVIRQKNTASDKAIMFGTLNDDAFTNFINRLNNNKILVVANSKLSYDLCNRILTRNNLKDKCVFLDKPHTIFNYWNFNKMVDDWKKVFELTK